MGTYDFQRVEKKWQQYWKEHRSFVADKLSDKPKYYVLDMFPYPSGAGLHVGHPLGYIATDIMARYKRAQGHNVLHPMGFDAFGLPAEQYAIKTGIHPAETTRKNIIRYNEQLEMLGFHYDPDAELSTSDPTYYKWTQWIFIQLFNHWYDKTGEKARPVTELEAIFTEKGNIGLKAATSYKRKFTAEEWEGMLSGEKADVLMQYRLAYLDYATVNWCPALGTVLANEEVKDGKSERGGHPVERREMKQWMLRITAYADRLLESLAHLEWSDAMKAMQTHWIGRSEGASVFFEVKGSEDKLEVFTTRPETLYGATFMVVAPEHKIVKQITTPEQKKEVNEYIKWAANRSEVDRMADTTKTGVWTGGYAINPMNGAEIPIWIADYVVISYGTGAIMAVPSGDQRDWEFARKFELEIIPVTETASIDEGADPSKDSKMINSDFLNGMTGHEAIPAMIAKLEEMGIGEGQVTYRQRDVIWSRQRYWGEPTPIYYDQQGVARPVADDELPLTLPEVDEYKPSPDGKPPLARAKKWAQPEVGKTRDLNTMPGLAGSSWYFMRYVDAHNEAAFADPERLKYWLPVDLYVGGTEHAVGHLMYSRFWTKFLFDMGLCPVEEPFKKLVNQGMIQGVSRLIYRHKETNEYVSVDLIPEGEMDRYSQIHTDVNLVQNGLMDVEGYVNWTQEKNATFRLNEQGEFHTTSQVEKMSKSLYNTVDPAKMCEQYGADVLRLYEMFLGPIEMAKPWNTDGISGVSTFVKRFWNLFVDEENNSKLTDGEPGKEELKVLHEAIKQTKEGIERLAFNTCVPAYMVLSKELQRLKCTKRAILEPFVVIVAPFAPHICEELWQLLGNEGTVMDAEFPAWNPDHLVADTIEYPVQVNGKMRAKITVPADADKKAVEEVALADSRVQEFMGGKAPRKVIVVPGRIVNVVV